MDSVFVVSGHSESGDDYVAVFRNDPTEKQLSELVHSWDGNQDYMDEDELNQGPGYAGSYVHINVEKLKFQD